MCAGRYGHFERKFQTAYAVNFYNTSIMCAICKRKTYKHKQNIFEITVHKYERGQYAIGDRYPTIAYPKGGFGYIEIFLNIQVEVLLQFATKLLPFFPTTVIPFFHLPLYSFISNVVWDPTNDALLLCKYEQRQMKGVRDIQIPRDNPISHISNKAYIVPYAHIHYISKTSFIIIIIINKCVCGVCVCVHSVYRVYYHIACCKRTQNSINETCKLDQGT